MRKSNRSSFLDLLPLMASFGALLVWLVYAGKLIDDDNLWHIPLYFLAPPVSGILLNVVLQKIWKKDSENKIK